MIICGINSCLSCFGYILYILFENEEELLFQSPQYFASIEKEMCSHKVEQELETLEVYGAGEVGSKKKKIILAINDTL